MSSTLHVIFLVVVSALCSNSRIPATGDTETRLWWKYINQNLLSAMRKAFSKSTHSTYTEVFSDFVVQVSSKYALCERVGLSLGNLSSVHITVPLLCNYLTVDIASPRNQTTYVLQIVAPKFFFLNITFLHQDADSDPVFCPDKFISIEEGPSGTSEREDLCGRPHPRTLIIQHNMARIRLQYKDTKKRMTAQFHCQIATQIYPGRIEMARMFRNLFLLGKEYPQWIEDRILQDFDYYASFSMIWSPPGMQPYPLRLYIWTVSLTKLRFGHSPRFGRAVLRIVKQNCSRREIEDDLLSIYDGPYAGVLSGGHLKSPFVLLGEVQCRQLADKEKIYRGSIGELTITLAQSQPLNDTVKASFEYLGFHCPGENCWQKDIQISLAQVRTLSFFQPATPMIQMLYISSPDEYTYINIIVRILDDWVPYSRSCKYDGVYIFNHGLKGVLCTGDGIAMFNSTTRAKGIQFDHEPVIVVLKMYPQTTKINVSVEYQGTSCLGLVNTCPSRLYEFTMPEPDRSASCRKYFYHTFRFDKVGLELTGNCCVVYTYFLSDYIQWDMHQCFIAITTRRNENFEWQVESHFPNSTTAQCLQVTLNAADYPFVGGTSMSVKGKFSFTGSHLGLTINQFCYPITTFYWIKGRRQQERCANHDVSAIFEESKMQNATEIFYEPFGFCGELKFSTTTHTFSLLFNHAENSYVSYAKRSCCAIEVRFKHTNRSEADNGTPMNGDIQASLTHQVRQESGYLTCNGEIQYIGIPRSLILKDTYNKRQAESFLLLIDLSTSSYHIRYKARSIQRMSGLCSQYLSYYSSNVTNRSTKDEKWICGERNCYIASFDHELSWIEAQSSCQKHRGNLLSINDDYEWKEISCILQELCFNTGFVFLGLLKNDVSIDISKT